jgi:hypothetical protein
MKRRYEIVCGSSKCFLRNDNRESQKPLVKKLERDRISKTIAQTQTQKSMTGRLRSCRIASFAGDHPELGNSGGMHRGRNEYGERPSRKASCKCDRVGFIAKSDVLCMHRRVHPMGTFNNIGAVGNSAKLSKSTSNR